MSSMADQKGPLAGLKVIEMAGIGPAPFGVTLLADAGMEVIRIERSSGSTSPVGAVNPAQDPMLRGRRCIALDLKNPQGTEVVLRLLEQADALVEGFRPGVMERLGLGPELCMARKPSLVCKPSPRKKPALRSPCLWRWCSLTATSRPSRISRPKTRPASR